MDKKIIHTVFEEIVRKQPLKIAIETEEISITYHDLNRYANRLSNLLKSIGCKTGMIVNVVVPSSIQLVGSMLSIFKSGAVFLPVDLTFSEKRMKQIFSETSGGIVIVTADTYNSVIDLINKLNIEITHLIVVDHYDGIKLLSFTKDKFINIEFNETAEWEINPIAEVSGDSSNCIFYTSGSTGEGKAIVGKNSGLSHFIHWEIKEFAIDDSFRVSQLTQVTFDPSLRDIFVALISGGTLCIPSAGIKTDPAQLLNWLEKSKINLVHCVPTLFRLITKELSSDENMSYDLSHIKYILLAGELLYARDIINWRKVAGNKINLVNLYGPTETTLAKAFHRIDKVSENPVHIIPVGIPISNTIIAIVKEGHICKVGEIGEIYIKTPFMSKGYYKNEKLTNECFVQNPLLTDVKDIVYKTGDLGRYINNGNIEVLGRLDSQVKVNGVRTELIEVEQAILANEKITGAVVKTHRTDDNFVSLIAYYTGKKYDGDQFRESLGKVLNQQIIPSYFIYLDEFPLNINGKVDKKALPLPEDILMGSAEIEPPVGILENKLAVLWKEILGVEKISRNVSFFNIGGHSLRAIQLISRIRKEFDVNLKIADIFLHRTIQNLASFISNSLTNEYKPIIPIAERAHYPLSSAQRRLWILSQIDEGSVAYHLPGAYKFEGDLDKELLNRSLNDLIDRHEILRTVFRRNTDGEIAQYILPLSSLNFKLEYIDYRDRQDAAERIKKDMKEGSTRPFDLTEWPLLRATLYEIRNKQYVFFYNMHHIISDGWSMALLIKEMLITYNSYARSEDSPLQPLHIQYKDYSIWQKQELEGPGLINHKTYWLKQFSGELPVLALASDKLRPPLKTYFGEIVNKRINSKLSNGLKSLIREQDCTLFMGVLAIVNTLLYKYTNQSDIIIGSPIAGREHNDLDNQIGFYVNTLALRTQFKGTDNFKQLLQNVKAVTLGAYEHQVYPFDVLVGDLDLRRDMSRNPLFDVSVSLQNINIFSNNSKDICLNGVNVSFYQDEELVQMSKFDLSLDFKEVRDELALSIEYNTDIYYKATVEQLTNHLEQLIEEIIKFPELPIDEIGYLSETEKDQLFHEFNNTAMPYPDEATLIGLFEKQAEKNPDTIAVVFNGTELSYRELNERSNQLAGYLRKKYHIKPNDLLGIKLDRSEWMIISILGVLKSGGAYIPVDPEYPEERIDYIMQDSNCKVLIDEHELLNFMKEIKKYTNKNVEQHTKANDLAYVIYTSGSTGKPKGCMLENKGVINRIEWMWKHYGYTPEDVILQKTTFTFDVSVGELFMPLCWGAKMVLCQKEDVGSPERIVSLINRYKVTYLHFVPSMLNTFIQLIFNDPIKVKSLNSLKRLIVSGEALTTETVRKWYDKTGITILNLYGPTEASIEVAYYEAIKGDTKIPIGRPIWNTQMYILDEQHQLCAIGVIGEICIGGIGLARGYLNKPELTAEKFIANPFKNGERIYKTGDLGRWLPDGNIEYIGREDDQVKIRGYRIELGEIENALHSIEPIEKALVIAKQLLSGEKILIVYAVSKQQLNTIELRSSLAKQLPVYMIPDHFIQLETFPLSSNGKVDKNALPDPYDLEILNGVEYIAARNEVERQLVTAYEEVLKKQPIGIKEDFFILGGDSLKSIQIVSRLNQIGYVLAIRDILLFPTIESLAGNVKIVSPGIPENKFSDKIADSLAQGITSINNDPENSKLGDLSYNQCSYLVDWENKNSITFFALELAYVEVDAFKRAVNKIIKRHEILRTVFVNVNGTVKQRVLPEEGLNFEIAEPAIVFSAEEMNSIIAKEKTTKFDLHRFPLFSIKMCKPHKGNYLICCTMHHIISDGFSGGILQDEIIQIYLEKISELKPLLFQYRDFVDRQRRFVDSSEGSEHKEYWLNKLKGFDPAIKWYSSSEVIKKHNYSIHTTELINGVFHDEIKYFAKENRLTQSVLLMGALTLLLKQLSDQNDITLSTAASGRHSKYYQGLDVSALIGLFVNTLLVRNIIKNEKSVIDYLHEVQNNFLDDLSYETYPFGKLINELPGINHSEFSNTKVTYNYHNYTYLKESNYAIEETDNKRKLENKPLGEFSLSLAVMEYNNCLKLDFAFNGNLISHEHALEIRDCYFSILRQIVYNPQLLIRQMKEQPEEKNAGVHFLNS
jgi:amino acid adenylation domain-containing protein